MEIGNQFHKFLGCQGHRRGVLSRRWAFAPELGSREVGAALPVQEGRTGDPTTPLLWAGGGGQNSLSTDLQA